MTGKETQAHGDVENRLRSDHSKKPKQSIGPANHAPCRRSAAPAATGRVRIAISAIQPMNLSLLSGRDGEDKVTLLFRDRLFEDAWT